MNTNRTRTVTRSLPYTVTYSVNGQVKKKRFKTPTEAWSYMNLVNGSLCFGFRVFG